MSPRARWALAVAVGAVVVVVVAVDTSWYVLAHAPKGTLVDLEVYRRAGEAFLDGSAVYDEPGRVLVFTYPPVAALVAVLLLPFTGWWGHLAWTALTVVATVALVAVAFRPALDRVGAWAAWARPLLLAGLAAVVVSTNAMENHLGYGQINVFLCLACLVDLLPLAGRRRWPQGLLVGFATALKLTPGVFALYLAVTERWRALATAAGAFLAATAVGALLVPGGGWEFWTGTVLDTDRVAGSVGHVSNQSLLGALHRAVGEGAATWLWPVVAAAVLAYGLVKARRLSRRGDEWGAVGVVALLAVLVSPISWFHHLVWIVPAIAALAGDLRDRRRVAAAAVALAVLWYPFPQASPWLENTDAVLALALLVAYPVHGWRREVKGGRSVSMESTGTQAV